MLVEVCRAQVNAVELGKGGAKRNVTERHESPASMKRMPINRTRGKEREKKSKKRSKDDNNDDSGDGKKKKSRERRDKKEEEEREGGSSIFEGVC